MNELTLDGKTYVSSKRAAEITGYAKDYVGQLCREGHVEARLVGRNWYVLESSIREHRFGAPEATVETPKEAKSDWESPTYEAEKSSFLPSLSETPAILTDMESAWREWFTQKKAKPIEEAIYKEEIIEEVPEEGIETPVAEIIEEETAEEPKKMEEEATPVPITAIYENEDEPVMVSEALEDAPEEVYEEDVVTTVTPIRRRREATRAQNLILQSIFLGVSLIAVAVAAIGSGYVSKLGDFGVYGLSEIKYIAGVELYNR